MRKTKWNHLNKKEKSGVIQKLLSAVFKIRMRMIELEERKRKHNQLTYH